MLKETIIGVVVASSGVVGGWLVSGIESDSYPFAYAATIESVGEAGGQVHADQFVSILQGLQKGIVQESDDGDIRGRLAYHFAEAYKGISSLEANGMEEEATFVRDTIDKAIGVYLESTNENVIKDLSHDLHIYSKFLTETHIALATEKYEKETVKVTN